MFTLTRTRTKNTHSFFLLFLSPGMSALRGLKHCSTSHIATYCNTPQHTATPSKTLQHSATRMWPHKRTRTVALYHAMHTHDHRWSCVYTTRLHQVAHFEASSPYCKGLPLISSPAHSHPSICTYPKKPHLCLPLPRLPPPYTYSSCRACSKKTSVVVWLASVPLCAHLLAMGMIT